MAKKASKKREANKPHKTHFRADKGKERLPDHAPGAATPFKPGEEAFDANPARPRGFK